MKRQFEVSTSSEHKRRITELQNCRRLQRAQVADTLGYFSTTLRRRTSISGSPLPAVKFDKIISVDLKPDLGRSRLSCLLVKSTLRVSSTCTNHHNQMSSVSQYLRPQKIPKRETLGPFDWDLIGSNWCSRDKE